MDGNSWLSYKESVSAPVSLAAKKVTIAWFQFYSASDRELW
jgi:hypothetical protein